MSEVALLMSSTYIQDDWWCHYYNLKNLEIYFFIHNVNPPKRPQTAFTVFTIVLSTPILNHDIDSSISNHSNSQSDFTPTNQGEKSHQEQGGLREKDNTLNKDTISSKKKYTDQ